MNLFIYMYSKSRFESVFCRRIVKARKVDRALHNVFCIVTLSIVIYVDNRDGSIVIIHSKYSKFLSGLPPLGAIYFKCAPP
jgi:hypothetical protein